MMTPIPNACQILTRTTKLCQSVTPFVRFFMFLLLFSGMVWEASAQSVIWSDSFKKGVTPSAGQCENWSQFLDQLAGKSFVSVTISGSRDLEGKTLSDPAAATQLAHLLSTRTPGTVHFEGHRWTVTECMTSVCGDSDHPYSIALSYDGNTSACDCSDKYAIRPQSANADWGGINVDYSCTNSPDQTMKLVFSSGVTLSAVGSTTLCEGSTVELRPRVAICSGQVNYLWSTGATTESITVSQPGNYSVTVSGNDGCIGTSEAIVVTRTDVTVNAGADATYCDEPIRLSATGASMSATMPAQSTVCIFSPPTRDCVFTSNVCLERALRVGPSSYSTNVMHSNAVKLVYNIYYSAFKPSTFRFKLNNREIGSHYESNATGVCDTKGEGKFPQSFTFEERDFKQYWINGGTNELRVEIETPDQGVFLAGITADVTTSNESYSWSPIDGLSHAFLKDPFVSPETTMDYTVTYTDANGCSATDVVNVKVKCEEEQQPPVAVCKELVVELTEGCEALVDAIAFGSESTSPSGGSLSFSVSPEGPFPVGVTNVVLTVNDANGSSSCQTKITVKDSILPVISEADAITVSNDEGACSAVVILEAPDAIDNCEIKSVTHDQDDNVFPVGETLVTWTAEDIHGNVQTAAQKVIVSNVDPVISTVRLSASTVAIGNPVRLTANIADNNVRSATIDWGDSSSPKIISNPSTAVEASHSYAAAGTYNITVSILDHCDASASYTYESVYVYDGSGSVRGDGWFDSERGFYVKNPRASGKVQFHFDAKYKKGSSIPVGSISFKFKSGDLEFKSSQLTWLIVQDDRATLYGTGKLNRSKDHTILISAVDADWNDDDSRNNSKKGKKKKDEIRVRIWGPTGEVIYDTQIGEPNDAVASTGIGGGSIDIKQNKFENFAEQLEDALASYFGEGGSVYPNPFDEWLSVQYNSEGGENVVIQLTDLAGKVVVSEVFPVSDDGHYGLDIPDQVREGIYVLVIKQGKRVEYLRLVRNR